MPPLTLTAVLFLAACNGTPAPPPAATHAEAPAPRTDGYEGTLTRLLQVVVTEDGLVDYACLGGDHAAAFDSVLMAVENYDPAALTTDAEKLAFFINAYNVRMLKHVLDAPDVDNIAADARFEAFFQTPVRVAGHDLTLNQLENGVLRLHDTVDGAPLPEALKALRPSRLDARLHVGLNCAAVSCPPLRREAFTPEALDRQLDVALADFAHSERFARVDGSAVVLSSLLDWFGADFDASGRPAGDIFLAAMSPERPGYARLRSLLEGRDTVALRAHVEADPAVSFAYDWTVNRK